MLTSRSEGRHDTRRLCVAYTCDQAALACRSLYQNQQYLHGALFLTLRCLFFWCSASIMEHSQVAVGGQHAALVTRNGKLYEWGAGVGGRLLAGSEATAPERVPTLWSRRCVSDGL